MRITYDPAADAAYIHLTGQRLARGRTSIPATPPEGPPRGTNFSRRKAMQPFPPSPAFTRIFASSMNIFWSCGDLRRPGRCALSVPNRKCRSFQFINLGLKSLQLLLGVKQAVPAGVFREKRSAPLLDFGWAAAATIALFPVRRHAGPDTGGSWRLRGSAADECAAAAEFEGG